MNTFRQILELAKQEGGKYFIVDTEGDITAVILSMEEYKKLKSVPDMEELSSRLNELSQQAEQLNLQITQAQIDDVDTEDDDDDVVAEELRTTSKAEDTETLYLEALEEID